MLEQEVHKQTCKIVNKHGLHTRSAAAIVELANQYECSISVASDKGESDAKDMIRLMLLEATLGSSVDISATGNDAKSALSAMANLIAAGFYEEDD